MGLNAIKSTTVNCSTCEDRSCAAAALLDTEIDLLSGSCLESRFRKGDVIIHQGSMLSQIIYVRSGLVLEYIRGESGRNQIIQIVKSRSYLGLPSLFGNRINHYSYKALEDLKVCFINIESFNELIRKNGSFAYEILVSVCQDSLNSHHRFLNINIKQTYGKIADALLYFASIIFESNTFELSLTKTEIGALANVSRESASRAMNKFQNDGIILVKGNNYKILKPDVLEQISRSG